MALIKCPECGKEVSDNSKECIHCGFPIVKEIDKPMKKKKPTIIVLSLIFILIFSTGAWYLKTQEAKLIEAKLIEEKLIEAKSEYVVEVDNLYDLIYENTIECESVSGDIALVWYNANNKVYDDSKTDAYVWYMSGRARRFNDFNTAISLYFENTKTESKINDIVQNDSVVLGILKELNNPPEEYIDLYDELTELYAISEKLMQMAVNPSGNYLNYTSTRNELIESFLTSSKLVLSKMPNDN